MHDKGNWWVLATLKCPKDSRDDTLTDTLIKNSYRDGAEKQLEKWLQTANCLIL